MTTSETLRVVVVNDSATVRASLRRALAKAPDVEVVGEGDDGDKAVELVLSRRPAVVLMDVVMPRVDGYAATRAIMAQCPVPIVLVSSVVNPRDVAVAMESLRSGALAIVEALPSPHAPEYAYRLDALLHLLRSMARVRVGSSRVSRATPAAALMPSFTSSSPHLEARGGSAAIVGVVASTGGPGVLVTMFRAMLDRPLPPVLLVQHLAPGFCEGFARWLDTSIGRPVRVAAHQQPLERGVVYVAPEDRHLGADAAGHAVVSDEPAVGMFRPSGTWMLHSLARAYGSQARGVVLTGMGADGAEGAAALRRAGGRVAAQNEATCVVYGMPGQTVACGGADAVLAPEQIAAWLTEGDGA